MNTDQYSCPVCNESATLLPRTGDFEEIQCHRCGEFKISGSLSASLQHKKKTKRQRAITSSLLRERAGQNFMLDINNQHYFFEARDIPMLEKADKLLLWIASQLSGQDSFSDLVSFVYEDSQLQSLCWAMDAIELEAILEILHQQGFTEDFSHSPSGKIRAKGWEHLDQLRTPNQDCTQGFVAMWFAPEMDGIFTQVISPAIEEAGYKPLRVDQHEHADKIDDEIIRQIRSSRFVVADATGQRGGVYYEAGFAHGLGLPVFWTCKKGENLHFDVRQYNCIFWEEGKLEDFKLALTRRIEAVLGRGPR